MKRGIVYYCKGKEKEKVCKIESKELRGFWLKGISKILKFAEVKEIEIPALSFGTPKLREYDTELVMTVGFETWNEWFEIVVWTR